jgi:hypothetical protein
MAWHARLSASQTKTWVHCPSTIALKEAYPERDRSGIPAQLGTCAHALIERCLETGVEPFSYKGRIIAIINLDTDDEGVSILKVGAKDPDQKKGRFLVDEDMIDATTKFCSYIWDRLSELFPKLFPVALAINSKIAYDKGLMLLESRTNPLPHRADTGGSADVTLNAWPEELEVVDYKNGSGVFVPVFSNWQLLSYTAGRAHETGWDHERYRYTIVQPRHYKAPDDGVMSEECTPAALLAFTNTLDVAATRVDEARNLLQETLRKRKQAKMPTPSKEDAMELLFWAGYTSTEPDGDHCTFCSLLPRCPAAMAKLKDVAMADFAELSDEPPEDLSIASSLVPDDNKRLAELRVWSPFIKKLIDSAEKETRRRLLEGQSVPGFKAIKSEGNREWSVHAKERMEKDADAFAKAVAEEFGVGKAELRTDPKPADFRSGPQIMAKIKGKELKAQFETGLLYRPAKIAIVTEGHPSPSYVPSSEAGEDFADMEDEDDG